MVIEMKKTELLTLLAITSAFSTHKSVVRVVKRKEKKCQNPACGTMHTQRGDYCCHQCYRFHIEAR